MTRKETGIESLSNELLRDILDHIEADPEKSIDIHRRAYLSVESFKPPPLPSPGQAEAIANFRRVCKRFSDLGIPYQYSRLATRFSTAGFERLRCIAEQPHLARAVKKFTYLVPLFYVDGMKQAHDVISRKLIRGAGRSQLEQLVHVVGGQSRRIDPQRLTAKANEQRDIIDNEKDTSTLRFAIAQFSSLQHIQLLRLQDQFDRELLDYLRRNREVSEPLVQLEWTTACLHATKTIGKALVASKSPASRFSGPMMDPQSAIILRAGPRTTVSSLASRLTCLELHFDDPVGLDDKMKELSPLFKSVFTAAINMQAVHLGFPARSPLSIPLEEVFHEVQWEKLRAFGIQAWRLDGDEIVKLARRYRRTLRGLRLRDVLLKEGSKWKDVLAMLRVEMEMLDWVSLRRAGYAAHFDEHVAGTIELHNEDHHEIPPSDSDDEWEENAGHHNQMDQDGNEDNDGSSGSESGNEDDDDDDASGDNGDESEVNSEASDHGPEANDLGLDTPVSAPYCTCGRVGWSDDPDDLGDNGINVSYTQRKMWEQWVIGRCLEHSRSF